MVGTEDWKAEVENLLKERGVDGMIQERIAAIERFHQADESLGSALDRYTDTLVAGLEGKDVAAELAEAAEILNGAQLAYKEAEAAALGLVARKEVG